MVAPGNRAALQFFGLILLASLPFYLLGLTGAHLPGPVPLPLSVGMVVVPMGVAVALTWRDRGWTAAVALMRRAFDLRRMLGARHGPMWLAVAFLFMPFVTIAAFAILRVTGTAVPLPAFTPADAMLIFALYVLGAIPEEIGWQAFAYPVLQPAHSALSAALIVGAVWALWHLIPYVLMGRGTGWIFWHSLCTVLLRVVIVWLVVNAGGSVFIAVVFHAMLNTVWSLFPVNGSFYDPRVTFAVLLPVVFGIVAVWGPATLTRGR